MSPEKKGWVLGWFYSHKVFLFCDGDNQRPEGCWAKMQSTPVPVLGSLQ